MTEQKYTNGRWLTDDVSGIPQTALLNLRQNSSLKCQGGHTEEEIPDTVPWNGRNMKLIMNYINIYIYT